MADGGGDKFVQEETWIGLQFTVAREVDEEDIERIDVGALSSTTEHKHLDEHVHFVYYNCEDPALVTDAQVADLVKIFSNLSANYYDLLYIFGVDEDFQDGIEECSMLAFRLARRLLRRAPKKALKLVKELFAEDWTGFQLQVIYCGDRNDWKPFFDCPETRDNKLIDRVRRHFITHI